MVTNIIYGAQISFQFIKSKFIQDGRMAKKFKLLHKCFNQPSFSHIQNSCDQMRPGVYDLLKFHSSADLIFQIRSFTHPYANMKNVFFPNFKQVSQCKISEIGLGFWMGDRLGLLLLSFLDIFKNLLNKINSFDYKLKSQTNGKKNYICKEKKIQAKPGFEPGTFRLVK